VTPRATIVRRRPEAPPIYLLDVEAQRGDRTRVTGALWDGVLNASPEDTTDGPSPVEALLAGVAGCFVRNLRWYADGSHLALDRIRLRLAAERSDDPPAITDVTLDVELETAAAAGRVKGAVERALQSGTITRTVARACRLEVRLRINDESVEVTLPDWSAASGR
jgi:uncharacterized OsmC-like protein